MSPKQVVDTMVDALRNNWFLSVYSAIGITLLILLALWEAK